MEPTQGMVTRNLRLRIGRFSQHHVDELKITKSALEKVDIDIWKHRECLTLIQLEQFREDYPTDPPQQIRKHLGSMGVTGELLVNATICEVSHSLLQAAKANLQVTDDSSNNDRSIDYPKVYLEGRKCELHQPSLHTRETIVLLNDFHRRFRKPHLLLLDEPTNHLDLDTVQVS